MALLIIIENTVYVCVCVCLHRWMCIYMHARARVCVCVCVCVSVCVYICMGVQARHMTQMTQTSECHYVSNWHAIALCLV